VKIWGRLMAQVKRLYSECLYLVQYSNSQQAYFWNKYTDMQAEKYYNGEENPYSCFQDYVDSNRAFLISKYWNNYFKNLRGGIKH